MKIRFLVVGKLKESYWKAAEAEYRKRLAPYAQTEVVELTDYPTPEHASFKEEEEIKRKEGQEILAKLKPNDFCSLLDLEQKQPDSLEMEVYLEKWMRQSGASLTFVIGGSLGLSEEVRQRGNAVLTLSRLTLTHQMTRVFLWEILYRSFKIAHHEPYHK